MSVVSEFMVFLSNLDPKYYLLVAILISLLFFVYNLIITLQIRSLQKRYSLLTKGSDKKNIDDLFEEYFEKIDQLSGLKEEVLSEIDHVKLIAEAGLYHVGVVRYSAYDEVGGDLSFSLALLDGDYSGVMLTSIFGRNDSRTYAKPVVRGESNYTLTLEEKEAIRRAALPRTFTRRGNRKN